MRWLSLWVSSWPDQLSHCGLRHIWPKWQLDQFNTLKYSICGCFRWFVDFLQWMRQQWGSPCVSLRRSQWQTWCNWRSLHSAIWSHFAKQLGMSGQERAKYGKLVPSFKNLSVLRLHRASKKYPDNLWDSWAEPLSSGIFRSFFKASPVSDVSAQADENFYTVLSLRTCPQGRPLLPGACPLALNLGEAPWIIMNRYSYSIV